MVLSADPLPCARHFLYWNEDEGWEIIRSNETGKQQTDGERASLGARDSFLPVDRPWREGVGSEGLSALPSLCVPSLSTTLGLSNITPGAALPFLQEMLTRASSVASLCLLLFLCHLICPTATIVILRQIRRPHTYTLNLQVTDWFCQLQYPTI